MRSTLPRTVIMLGIVSFLTDVSSEMIYPLLPVFLAGTLGATAVSIGLIVTATKRWQQINWSIPLTDGTESGWGVTIDLSGIEQPDAVTREVEALADESGEPYTHSRAALAATRSGNAPARTPPSSGISARYRDRSWIESIFTSRCPGSRLRS